PVSIQLLETEASRKDVTVATYEAEGEIKTGTFWKEKCATRVYSCVKKRRIKSSLLRLKLNHMFIFCNQHGLIITTSILRVYDARSKV
ncbi:MAG: hypothetical protein ACM3WQ_03305, partial [Chloroflexota bacterium]